MLQNQKIYRFIFLTVLAFLAFADIKAQSPAAPIEAAISTSNETPEVAQSVTLTIEIKFNPADTRILGVEWKDGDFERLPGLPSPAVTDLPDGRKLYTQSIPAQTWEIDEAKFGPVTINYEANQMSESLTLDPVTYKIKSLLPDENAAIGEMRTPMLTPPPPYALYAIIGGMALLALLIIGAIIFWLTKRRSRVTAPAPRPLGPPDLEALAAIDALVDSDLLEQGEIKEFFTRLGDIVREYLYRRFGLMAHELTSYELLIAIEAVPTIMQSDKANDLRALLEGMFTLCDLVKFAKHRPERAAIDKAVDQAREFVVLTRPRIDTPTNGNRDVALSNAT